MKRPQMKLWCYHLAPAIGRLPAKTPWMPPDRIICIVQRGKWRPCVVENDLPIGPGHGIMIFGQRKAVTRYCCGGEPWVRYTHSDAGLHWSNCWW